MKTLKNLASTAMALALASVKTVANPSVAFAGGPDMSFKDRVAMEMNSGCARDTEVRDPKTVAMLTGQVDLTTTACKDVTAHDQLGLSHATLQMTGGSEGAAVMATAMSDGTCGAGEQHGVFDQVRH